MAAEASSTPPAAAASGRTTSWVGNSLLLTWLAYLLFAPTIGFNWIESWHNEQRAVQVVLLVWTALVFATLVILDGAAIRATKGVAQLAATFLVLGAVSAARSAHPLAAFAEVSLLVLLAALTVLTATITAAAPERTAAWARYFALLFCAAYSLGVAVRLFAALQLGRPVDLEVLVFGYANPRFPSAFHAALLPLVALVAVDGRETRWLRIVAVLLLAAVWAINWGLGTRGIWFSYLLALPVLALLVGWRRMAPIAGVLALTAVVGVACFELLLQLTAPTASGATAIDAVRPINNMTLTSREVLWSLSWNAISESPLLGIGPMHFATLGSHVGAHPHNWVLQAAAEWGLPAALILGVLAVFLIAGMRQRTGPFDVAISCSILASMSLALVDGNLVMPITQTAFALAIGLSLGVSGPTQGGNRLAFGGVLIAAALAASICVAHYAVSSFSAHETARDAFQRSQPGVWLLPRFWEHSLF